MTQVVEGGTGSTATDVEADEADRTISQQGVKATGMQAAEASAAISIVVRHRRNGNPPHHVMIPAGGIPFVIVPTEATNTTEEFLITSHQGDRSSIDQVLKADRLATTCTRNAVAPIVVESTDDDPKISAIRTDATGIIRLAMSTAEGVASRRLIP